MIIWQKQGYDSCTLHHSCFLSLFFADLLPAEGLQCVRCGTSLGFICWWEVGDKKIFAKMYKFLLEIPPSWLLMACFGLSHRLPATFESKYTWLIALLLHSILGTKLQVLNTFYLGKSCNSDVIGMKSGQIWTKQGLFPIYWYTGIYILYMDERTDRC